MTIHSSRSLAEQRLEFSRSRFLAMPIAGTIAWAIIGITSPFVPVGIASWILFICTGMIFALSLLIARFVGEDLIGNTRNANEFDRLFFVTLQMSWLVFAIAIPFFLIEPTSLPLAYICAYSPVPDRLVRLPRPAFCCDPCHHRCDVSDHNLCVSKTTQTLSKGEFQCPA